MQIAIVGAGWAGLSCAIRLTQHQRHAAHRLADSNALRVSIFEAAPHCGGRARGLIWNGHAIDNGQHLTIGAYRQTFALLRQVGAHPWNAEPMVWSGVSRQNVAQRWRVPDAAWPARVLAALIPGKGPQGWPLSWRWSVARTLAHLARHDWTLPCVSAAQWLEYTLTPKGLIDHFWRPLTEGALNTRLKEASAPVLARVLRDSLGGAANATHIVQPHKNLSADGVDPMAHWLARHHVPIELGHRVLAIERNEGLSLTLRHASQTRRQAFDAVVLALPFQETCRLWAESVLPPTPAIHRLHHLSPRAITTVWIELSSEALLRLGRLPAWFVLNPIEGVPRLGQVVVMRGPVMAVVISARAVADIDPARDRFALQQQLLAQMGIDIGLMRQKWITEKSATWACTPDTPVANDADAKGFAGIAGLYRCADDLEPGYPATIESAVRSGQRTADTLLQSLM